MTDESKIWTKSRMVVWWYYNSQGVRLPMFNSVGIFRLMKRYRDKDSVIFECLFPQAKEFLETVDYNSILEVRHVDCGRMDIPNNGEAVYYLKNIVPKEWWANRLTTVKYENGPVVLHLHADCDIDVVITQK